MSSFVLFSRLESLLFARSESLLLLVRGRLVGTLRRGGGKGGEAGRPHLEGEGGGAFAVAIA